MDSRELKAEFGRELTFWAGASTRNGSWPVERSRRYATRCAGASTTSCRRRFVFSAVHNIQADVPPGNIVAMLETLREYGVYRPADGPAAGLRPGEGEAGAPHSCSGTEPETAGVDPIRPIGALPLVRQRDDPAFVGARRKSASFCATDSDRVVVKARRPPRRDAPRRIARSPRKARVPRGPLTRTAGGRPCAAGEDDAHPGISSASPSGEAPVASSRASRKLCLVAARADAGVVRERGLHSRR